jgi:hypothetical protein
MVQCITIIPIGNGASKLYPGISAGVDERKDYQGTIFLWELASVNCKIFSFLVVPMI